MMIMFHHEDGAFELVRGVGFDIYSYECRLKKKSIFDSYVCTTELWISEAPPE